MLSVTWGFSFLFIKVAGGFLDPYQTTFARLALGALTLYLVLIFQRGRPVLHWGALKHLALIGTLSQAIPFTLFAWAEHHISSVAAGLMNSTMSLWTAALAILILPEERLSRFRLSGLLIGFVGVAVLLGVWDTDFRADWKAYLACGLSTIGYAVSVLWTRRFITPLQLDPFGAVSTQLSIGAVECLIVSLFVSSRPTHWPMTGVVSIVLLGAIGTGVALVLNFLLIKRAGAMATSTVTYSIPIVSTIAGVVILHETLHWYEPIGAVIVLFGISIVQQIIKPKVVADAL